MEQAEELFRLHTLLDLPLLLKNSALDCDHEQVDELIEQFREHADHVQEVCRLLFHVAPTSSLQVTAGHTETSIEIHSEQMLTALSTLVLYPTSKIAKENYEVFADVWTNLVGDISQIMHELAELIPNFIIHDRGPHQRPSEAPPPPPPRMPPGVIGSPSIATAPVAPMPTGPGATTGYMMPGSDPVPLTGDTAGDPYGHGAAIPASAQQPMAGGVPNEMVPPPPPQQQPPPPRPTNVSINPEVDVVEIGTDDNLPSQTVDLEENDIVRKAKSMSTMAMAMFQFTRGEGELKTTQDLFTQAEFFADEANKLYKIVRHFTYQVRRKKAYG